MKDSGIKVTLVDPRYISEEVGSPVCRVDFWDIERSQSFEHRLEHAASFGGVKAEPSEV